MTTSYTPPSYEYWERNRLGHTLASFARDCFDEFATKLGCDMEEAIFPLPLTPSQEEVISDIRNNHLPMIHPPDWTGQHSFEIVVGEIGTFVSAIHRLTIETIATVMMHQQDVDLAIPWIWRIQFKVHVSPTIARVSLTVLFFPNRMHAKGKKIMRGIDPIAPLQFALARRGIVLLPRVHDFCTVAFTMPWNSTFVTEDEYHAAMVSLHEIVLHVEDKNATAVASGEWSRQWFATYSHDDNMFTFLIEDPIAVPQDERRQVSDRRHNIAILATNCQRIRAEQ